MKKIISFITSLFLIFALFNCSELEREIDLELPAYESRLVVECYLEANNSYYVLITKSSPYFDPFPTLDNQYLSNILEDSAQVIIRHGNKEIMLDNQLGFNFSTNKLYNYINNDGDLVPEDYETPFELDIVTKEGETITATTKLLPVVPIDSIVVQFNDTDTLARVLTYFTDIPDQENYFRRMLHESSVDSLPQQDFTTDDRVIEDVVVFGTGYNYEVGDTVINTIFHINKAYYDFLESVQIAVDGNFNPFGQPSPIISNLEGTANAIGIFTGLSFDRRATIIEA